MPAVGSIPPDAVVPAEAPTANESLNVGVGDVGVEDASTPGEPSPSDPLPTPAPGRWPLVLAVGSLIIVVAAVLHLALARPAPVSSRPGGSPPIGAPIVATSYAPTAVSPPSPATSSAEEDLPPGAEVPPGFGLLEVRTPAGAIVRVDGAIAGAGPFVASVTAPGYHEVRVAQGGREATQVIEVRKGKATRIRPALLP